MDRKTYFSALYLGVVEQKGLEFKNGIQKKVRNLADQRFYGKMASMGVNGLSTRGISRNVGSFFGDEATNWQIITAISDRMYHSNNFLFSKVNTYRAWIRGLDIEAYDQNYRHFTEALIPRGITVVFQVVLAALDLFLPPYLVHGLIFVFFLYGLMRVFSTPGRVGATICLEILFACITRVTGRIAPLVASIALDYYFYSGKDYNTFIGGVSFRRSHLLHAINKSMKQLNEQRWRQLSAEIEANRSLKRRKAVRDAVALLMECDAKDKNWISVLGTKTSGSDEEMKATADEMAAVAVFLAETSTGDIVLVSSGVCVGRFAFRNRCGELFFRPMGNDESESVSISLTGRLIVGDVVVLAVAEVLDRAEAAEADSDSDGDNSGNEIDISSRPLQEQFLVHALESAVENTDCQMQ